MLRIKDVTIVMSCNLQIAMPIEDNCDECATKALCWSLCKALMDHRVNTPYGHRTMVNSKELQEEECWRN